MKPFQSVTSTSSPLAITAHSRSASRSSKEVRTARTELKKHSITKLMAVEAEVPHALDVKLMTPKRLAKLERCEKIITAGIASYFEMGCALEEVRRERLFAPDFVSFDAYVTEKWDFTKQRASQLINAAACVEQLSVTVDRRLLPTSERAVRELLKAPQAQHVRIVEIAAKKAKGAATTAAILEAWEHMTPAKKSAAAGKRRTISCDDAMQALADALEFLMECDASDLRKGQQTQLSQAFAKLRKGFSKLGLAA